MHSDWPPADSRRSALPNPSSTSIQSRNDVSVSLDYAGTLTATYPAYEDGWRVTAEPDGTLYDKNGNEYSYLFWEGEDKTDYDFSKGFCVAGADTADFLREKLAEIGLTPREYNEFIVYWLPKMQDNPYNLISFQSEAYTDAAKLDIDPTPDSVLRVFMAWKPLSKPQTIDRRHSRRLRETASPLWNGAAAR